MKRLILAAQLLLLSLRLHAADAKPAHDPLLTEIEANAGTLLLLSATWTQQQGGSWPQAVQTAVRAVLRAGAGPELPTGWASKADPLLTEIDATAGTLVLLSVTWSGGDEVRAMQTASRAVLRAAAGPELPMGGAL